MGQGKPTIVNDSFAWRLAVVYAAFFLIVGWHLPLFPVWLTARGLDPAAIGLVLAAMQAVRVIGTPVGTRIADRYGSLRGAVVAATLASVFAISLLGLASGFVFLLTAAVLLAFISAPVLPLTDAYGLRGLAQRGKSYGPVRLWGSIAFIAANLTGGMLLNVLTPGNLIWVICVGNCALAVAAMLLPPMPQERPARGAGSRSHLRQPAFLAIAAAASLIQASHAVYYGFSTLDWTARGFDGVTIGVLWALGVVAEIVLFAFAGRLPRRIGPVTLILIGAAGGIVRWGAMTLDPPILLLLLPLQLLHALSFGATHLGMMAFLSHNAPEGSRAAAQGDVSTASSLAMAAASAIAGVLYGASGAAAYAAMAALAAAGGASALLAARFTRPLPPKD